MKIEGRIVGGAAATAASPLLGITLAGCGGPSERAGAVPESGSPAAEAGAPESPLAGTQWRLVEFRSVDDATGTVRPEDPSLYTLRLNADGVTRFTPGERSPPPWPRR
jgi:hypothetical protein